jgi:hypothetical protein
MTRHQGKNRGCEDSGPVHLSQWDEAITTIVANRSARDPASAENQGSRKAMPRQQSRFGRRDVSVRPERGRLCCAS